MFVRRKFVSWLFSCLLDLVSGYGEQPLKTFLAHLSVVSGFAFAYLGIIYNFNLASNNIIGAVVYSLTSFHGRGFFPGYQLPPYDPRIVLAACEAVIGLFIELILIASFSRRFLDN